MSGEVRADTRGAQQLAATLDRAARDLDDLVTTNQRAGDLVLGAAVIPRDIGQLQKSAAVLGDAHGFELVAAAPYAGYVHARQPFFTDALERTADRVVDQYLGHVDDVLATVKGTP